MAMNHKATPEQWASVEEWAVHPGVPIYSSVILELRARVEALEGLHKAVVDLNESFNLDPLVARVEALEATQHVHADVWRLSDAEREQFYAEMARPARVEALEAAANSSAAPAGSLLDRVINAIAFEHEKTPEPRYEARAAIREVAAWLREQDPEPGPVGKWLGQISTPCGVMADMIEQEADR